MQDFSTLTFIYYTLKSVRGTLTDSFRRGGRSGAWIKIRVFRTFLPRLIQTFNKSAQIVMEIFVKCIMMF